jgi:hypothetical protein
MKRKGKRQKQKGKSMRESTKFQAPNSNVQNKGAVSAFFFVWVIGIWCLFGAWCL